MKKSIATVPKGLQKLSAKVGLGFSVPISVVNGKTIKYEGYTLKTVDYSAVGAGFRVNFLMGAQYDFTDHLAANLDWNLGLFGGWSNSIRAGVTWYF